MRFTVFSILTLASFCLLAKDGSEFERIYLGSRASLSPDGKDFAFEWCNSIWLAPVSGGTAKPLQLSGNKNTWPLFAPDGKRVAFLSERDGGNKIFEVELASGKVRQVSYHSESTVPHCWTRDGANLVSVVWRQGTGIGTGGRIAMVPANERRLEKILFDTNGGEPCLSPDGKQLLFTRGAHDPYRKRYRGTRAIQIWLYDLEKKSFKPVAKHETDSRTPIWTPDGKGFYYVSGQDGVMNVWHHSLSDSKEHQITFFKDDSVMQPTLSADGRTMVFRHLFDFYRIDPSRPAQEPQKITIYPGGAALRPESRRRYYNTCWNNDSLGSVTFCDNGMQIAFTTGGDLWVMDTVLRTPQLVHGETLTHERDCVFSPDGTELFYLSDRGDGTDIVCATRADAEKYWWENTIFNKRILINDSKSRSKLSISPDGNNLAWVEACGTLVFANTNGVEISRQPSASGVESYAWSPDSCWAIVSVADDYANYDVWIVSVNSPDVRYNISRHFSWDGSPCWSPDGKIVAFTGVRSNNATSLFYLWLNREDEERFTVDNKVASAVTTMQRALGQEKKEPDQSTNIVVKIDFEDLHQRVRQVQIPGSVPRRPFFSHDSRTLAFEATIGGVAGTYRITIPDRLKPELMTKRRGNPVEWQAKNNRLLWVSDNLPAHYETTFDFSAYQETNMFDYQELAYLTIWGKMRDWYYDDNFHGADWEAIRGKYHLAARHAPDYSVFQRVISLMLGELNSSHLGFVETDGSRKEWNKYKSFQSWGVTTPHLGLVFDQEHRGDGWKVLEVVPQGPADLVTRQIEIGDIVMSIDSTPLFAGMDYTAVLNGPADRTITLGVVSGTNELREVTVKCDTYASIRLKQQRAEFEQIRQQVHQASDGKLGYLHVRAMNWDEYYRFEQEIFAEGFGRDGLIIDVRNNTGGFTADRMLSVLCGSSHSIAVGRDAAPAYLSGYWGRPVWDKPIVVICNEYTASNGEIFTHAIKTLKRGKIVGIQTGGAVIAMPEQDILDMGKLRTPNRGWFLPDGTDMELYGAEPDFVVELEPGDIVAGRDPQLDKAISLLKEEVAKAQAQPPVKLRYYRD